MVEVKEISGGRELKSFIQCQFQIYKNDPFYTPQLTRDLNVHFSNKNPFFLNADVKFYIAIKDNNVVGRIVSIIDRNHNAYHNEKAGFFGFFESINNKDVSTALFNIVYNELKNHGIKIIRGPISFSTNEECGLLIDGFQYPPILMTPYNPPYYINLVEQYGFKKAKDLYSFLYEIKEQLPEKVLRVASIAEKNGFTVKHINKNNFLSDMQKFKKIYNSAWADNWGFIPITDDELKYISNRLKPLVKENLVLIAEKNKEPVGFLGMVPDYNIILRKMMGKITPLGILKALYYYRKIKDLRLLLFGVKAEYRNMGIEALLFKEGQKGLLKRHYKNVEFSWILEDTIRVINIVKLIGGELYKKHRIYEKNII